MAHMTVPRMSAASRLIGDEVVNPRGENLGQIEDLMLDLDTGSVSYAVLSFGGILGIGDKLFAVPWEALSVDVERDEFVMDVDRERLEEAPGFDKNAWPSTSTDEWLGKLYDYYGFDRGSRGEPHRKAT